MFDNILQLFHDHKDELLVMISLGAVCVSFLATLAGPAVQMYVARLNARTTILIANRVKWIESMQSNIANLTALVERTEFLTKSMAELKQSFRK